MDLTPQLVNDVDFRTKRGGGYDADEVDDFLERVATGVGELQERLREAQQRIAAAEARAQSAEAKLAEQGSRGEDHDETLKRTLVLAQRTADAAVREAEELAAQLKGEAEAHAANLRADAEQHSAQLKADAEAHSTRTIAEAEAHARALHETADAEARRGAEETRRRLTDEIHTLEATRDAVKADVALLERHVDEQRLRLRSAASDLQRLVDDPAGLRTSPMPALTGATMPVRETAAAQPPAVEPAVAEELVLDADVEAGPATETVPVFEDDFEVADEPLAVPADMSLYADDDDDDDDVWAAPKHETDGAPLGLFDSVTPDPLDTLSDERVSIWDTPRSREVRADDDDAYLSELRKAMIDEHDPTRVGDEVPRSTRPRFGRRR